MSVTDEIVELTVASPSAPALAAAAGELALFARAVAEGWDSSTTRALGQALAGTPGPDAGAWLTGTAAALSAQQPRWTSVCAAAVALAGADSASAAAAAGSAVADRTASLLAESARLGLWWPALTAGAIGAAAAAGSALALDPDSMHNAIGICATQAAGFDCEDGTSIAALQLGKAASTAVESALLAANGFTSAADSIGGRRGLLALMG